MVAGRRASVEQARWRRPGHGDWAGVGHGPFAYWSQSFLVAGV